MPISLTPELESRIKSRVESGLYNNASDVIHEQLKAGIDQLSQGEGIVIKSKEELDDLFEDIKR